MFKWIGGISRPPGHRLAHTQISGMPLVRAFRCHLPLLLAALLPLLQLGSVLHGLDHLSDSPRTDTADVSKDACALCAAYAMAGSILLVAPSAWPTFAVLAALSVTIAFVNATLLDRAYLARAPPAAQSMTTCGGPRVA